MLLNEFIDKLKSQGKSKNQPDKGFNQIELEIGTKVEFEHVDDKNAAKEIAKDHLAENSHYYTKVLAPSENEVKQKALKILRSKGYNSLEDWHDDIGV